MADFKTYRSQSRIDWGREMEPGYSMTDTDLKLGAILRIADATELMAKRHSELLSEIDRLKSSLAAARRNSEYHEARASANKGQATKWRNKFNALKASQ